MRESPATTTASVDRGGRPRIAPTSDGSIPDSRRRRRNRCGCADRSATRAARAPAGLYARRARCTAAVQPPPRRSGALAVRACAGRDRRIQALRVPRAGGRPSGHAVARGRRRMAPAPAIHARILERVLRRRAARAAASRAGRGRARRGREVRTAIPADARQLPAAVRPRAARGDLAAPSGRARRRPGAARRTARRPVGRARRAVACRARPRLAARREVRMAGGGDQRRGDLRVRERLQRAGPRGTGVSRVLRAALHRRAAADRRPAVDRVPIPRVGNARPRIVAPT